MSKDDEVVKEPKEEPSVDDLLSFINGNDEGGMSFALTIFSNFIYKFFNFIF